MFFKLQYTFMQIIASFPKVYNDFIAAKKQHKSFSKKYFYEYQFIANCY